MIDVFHVDLIRFEDFGDVAGHVIWRWREHRFAGVVEGCCLGRRARWCFLLAHFSEQCFVRFSWEWLEAAILRTARPKSGKPCPAATSALNKF